MDAHPLIIDAALVRSLVDTQFLHWKSLPIRPVAQGGWDNRTFHLGDQMLVRLPSTAEYAPNAAKERQWLPLLAPQLPLPIPVPLAQGKPTEAYPFPWSIYQWLDGASAAQIPPADKNRFAHDLAQFLTALWRINAPHGPRNLYRESLARYDAEAAQAITLLKDTIDTRKAALIWQKARATS